jgi:hypothetical protein
MDSRVETALEPAFLNRFQRRFRTSLTAISSKIFQGFFRLQRRCLPPPTRLIPVGSDRILIDVRGMFPFLVPSTDLAILPRLFFRGESDGEYMAFLKLYLRPRSGGRYRGKYRIHCSRGRLLPWGVRKDSRVRTVA